MLMTTSDPPADGRRDGRPAEAAALYRLMTWLSPSFPVGAFSYSSGIEWAVEAGDIADAASLSGWLASMLADGCRLLRRRVFGACPPRRRAGRRRRGCAKSPSLAAAFAPSRERQLETSSQGRAFIDIARSAWPCDGLERDDRGLDGAIAYPVAVGLVGAAHGIRLDPTLHAFLHAQTANWISAGSRLIPLGQTDSQRVLAHSSRWWSPPAIARCGPRSTISAARRFAPTLPACITRRSIRGCSGHEHERDNGDITRRDMPHDAKPARPACASASAARSAPARRR